MKLLAKLGQLLDRAIPAEARVDPAGFPEAEFPVHCPQCRYLLASVPEPRCPECGESFDRGRLLVEEYACPSRGRFALTILAEFWRTLFAASTGGWKHLGLSRAWLVVLFCATAVMCAVCVVTLMIGVYSASLLDRLLDEHRVWIGVVLSLAVCTAIAAVLRIGLAGIGGDAAMNRRRSAVRAALKETPRSRPQP